MAGKRVITYQGHQLVLQVEVDRRHENFFHLVLDEQPWTAIENSS